MPYNKNKYRLFYTLVLILITTIFWLLLHYRSQVKRLSPEFQKLYLVVKLIEKYYVEAVDVADVAESGLHRMLRELNPPGFVVEDEWSKTDSGEIGLTLLPRNGAPMIISTIPGSPADLAAIQTGDLLLKIDDTATRQLPFARLKNLLKGKIDSAIKLELFSAQFEENYTVKLWREKKSNPPVLASFMLDSKTGYLRAGNLNNAFANRLAQALLKLETGGIRQLLLDLRQVSKGTLNGALEVLSLFLPPNQRVLQIVGKNSQIKRNFRTNDHRKTHLLPLVVLINHGTARWAEAVAGTLQDLDRAVIVGENSLGLADIYETHSLKDQTRIRLATRRFSTASGRCPGRMIDSTSFWAELKAPAADSVRRQRGEFQTRNGRPVYAHEEITPDRVVAPGPRLHPNIGSRLIRFLDTNTGSLAEKALLNRFKHYLAAAGIETNWKTVAPEIRNKIRFSKTQSRAGLEPALIEAARNDPQILHVRDNFDAIFKSIVEKTDSANIW